MPWAVPVAAAVLLLLLLASCWRRCPPGKLLVVYGKVPGGVAVVGDRGRFVLPILQDSCTLSLDPVELPGGGRVRIGRDPARMGNAALHLVLLDEGQIAGRVAEALARAGGDAAAAERALAALGLERVPDAAA